jgi:Fe-S cluster biogenesis protein NfuA
MLNTVETKIEEILESIRPALKADGGDVEFLGFDEVEGVVELRLLGACEDCPISMMTLKEGIERRLKDGVPGVSGVKAV